MPNVPGKVSGNSENSQTSIDFSIAKESEELLRKIQKTRSVLNASGSIKVGTTPHEIVQETNAYKLTHFRPMLSKTARTPILIVYALINRSYILDLQPDKSWIHSLVSQGFDVYLIDWKPPTQYDKYTSFDDYVNVYLDDCVEFIRAKKTIDQVTLHGYCMGATMSAMYCTLHQEKVKNLATIAPVVDSSRDTTVLANFSKHLDANRMFSTIGNMPKEQLYSCYSALKPFKQGVNKYLNLVENIDNDSFVQNFLRVEKWLYDTPDIAGETFRQWILDIYQKNLLYKNEMKVGDHIIDLSKITIPFLNIVAEEDHLVSPECSVSPK